MPSNSTGGSGKPKKRKLPKRKPPARVVNLNGDPLGPDSITDEDYARAVAAQDATLFAAGNERRILGQLRVRLERGAVDAGEKYYFDLARGIVRRRIGKENAS
jgi:hypothetical protein